MVIKKKEPLSTSSISPTAATANSSAITSPNTDDIKLISKMANNEELDIFANDSDDDELDKLFAECGF